MARNGSFDISILERLGKCLRFLRGAETQPGKNHLEQLMGEEINQEPQVEFF